MAKVTPAQAADKWVRRMQGATQDMARGVNQVTESPATLAIAQKDRLIANFIESVNSGRWEAGLNTVSLSDWKTAMLEKGVPRISQGAASAQTKQERFFAKLLPVVDQLSEEISRMPKGTVEDSVARAGAMIRGMASRKGQFKG